MNIVLCIIFHGIQFEVQFSNCIFVFFQLKTIHIVLWEQYTLFYVVFHLAVFKSKGRRTFLQLFTASCLTVSISSSRRAIALFRSSTFKTRNNERNSAQKLLLHILTSGILILRLSRTLLSKSLTSFTHSSYCSFIFAMNCSFTFLCKNKNTTWDNCLTFSLLQMTSNYLFFIFCHFFLQMKFLNL